MKRLVGVIFLLCAACAGPGRNRAGPGPSGEGRLTLRRLTILDRTDFSYAIALSPDGASAAFTHLGADAYRLGLWSLFPPVRRADIELNPIESDVEAIAYSGDGQRIAVASRDGTLRLLNAAHAEALALREVGEPLVCVGFSPSGAWVVAGTAKGRLVGLKAPGLESAFDLKLHDEEVRGVAFLSEDRLIAAGWDQAVTFLALKGGTEGAPFRLEKAHTVPLAGYANDLSVGSSGQKAVVALSEVPAQRTVEVYRREKDGVVEPPNPSNAMVLVDLESGAVDPRWTFHHGVVSTAALSADGRMAASGGWDRTLHVIDLEKGDEASDVLGWSIRQVRFSSNGALLGVAAWTPQNPTGDHRSDPSALVYRLR